MFVHIYKIMSQIIIILIVANVLVSLKGFSDAAFFDRYKFQVQRILGGEKIRMLTSGFLHVDWLHLGFNMYALYLFGKVVDSSFGTLNFVLIYFASLIAGSMYIRCINTKECLIIVRLVHQELCLE
jgi:membrane associated rhomboid family serine protease